MPPINEDAIVLRTVDFSETSQIVTFFTREHGKIPCLAKGARRLKNPFDSALDCMNVCKILYYPKAGDALQLVTEAKLVERFRVRSLVAIYAGFHILDLLSHFTENFQPHSELFDLTRTALTDMVCLDSECVDATLEHPPESVSRALMHFEMRLLALSGLAPALDHCAECGKRIALKSTPRVPFGVADGGVLCADCRPGRRNVVSLSGPAWNTLRMLASPNPNLWKRLQITPKTLAEVRGVWNQFLTWQLERPAGVLRWLKR